MLATYGFLATISNELPNGIVDAARQRRFARTSAVSAAFTGADGTRRGPRRRSARGSGAASPCAWRTASISGTSDPKR